MRWDRKPRHRKPPPGRHLRPVHHENEIKAAIVAEARDRVTGHYSGVLTNGDSYEVDMTLKDFTIDFWEFELTSIR